MEAPGAYNDRMNAQGLHNDTDYAILSQFYDLEYSIFDADLEMYRQFAERARGPILELGCGTGRVLEALADLEHPITGIDTSPAMLEICRTRVDDRIVLVERDMREVAAEPSLPNGPFAFVLSAINTFLHLNDVQSQLATLRGLREVMLPGGIMLLDLMVPDPRYLGSLDGQLSLEFQHHYDDGSQLDKWVARTHDLASQLIVTTVYFDITSSNGTLTRHIDHYNTRYIHLYELEHLLARAGWDLVSLFGNYELEPFNSDSERIVALATPQR